MKSEIHAWGRCIALCFVIGFVGYRIDSGLSRVAASTNELRTDSITAGGILHTRLRSLIEEMHSIAVGVHSQK